MLAMNAIVGYTGFVGSNLYTPERFQAAYNTKNIRDAWGTSPDLLVYSGVRAEKYLANSDPDTDLKNIEEAQRNIEMIRPRKLILISTIDVFQNPVGVDETSVINPVGLHPYGRHRYLLENWARENVPDTLIVRLPGLFGKNLKKNFIYDFIHVIPSMLKADLFADLSERDPRLARYYVLQDNGFWKAVVPENEQGKVKQILNELGFSALNFTDSRSRFQFYPLRRLWSDLQVALQNGLRLLHLATEPVEVNELYRFLTGNDFANELGGRPAYYDFRTVHASCFGSDSPYLCGKKEIMKEISDFILEEQNR